MRITGRTGEDRNYVYVYTEDTVWTKAKATGQWGSRKVGECGYDRKSHEFNKNQCTQSGAFDIPD